MTQRFYCPKFYGKLRGYADGNNICNVLHQHYMDLYIVFSNWFGTFIHRRIIDRFQQSKNHFVIFSLSLGRGQHFEQISYMLLQSIMTTTAILVIIFVFCFSGNMVTSDAQLIAMYAYDSLWYLYPIKLRKYIIFVIMRSQLPFYFTGFHMTACTLGVFTGVSSTKN